RGSRQIWTAVKADQMQTTTDQAAISESFSRSGVVSAGA
ncbi:MAG: hypothetical protein QOJ58_72, partial [Alphaproteobacteria bacterium]|nr:hypothetical protein [Alphaproteobacteria bacterium]